MECFFVCPILGNLSTWVAIPYSFMYWPVLKFQRTGRQPLLVSVLKVGPILVIHTVCSLFNLIRQKVNNINLSYSEKIIHSHKECIRTAINFKMKSLWKKSYPPPPSITISFEKNKPLSAYCLFFCGPNSLFPIELPFTHRQARQQWAAGLDFRH